MVAHKTGTIGRTTNDVGVVTLPSGAGHVVVGRLRQGLGRARPRTEAAIAEGGPRRPRLFPLRALISRPQQISPARIRQPRTRRKGLRPGALSAPFRRVSFSSSRRRASASASRSERAPTSNAPIRSRASSNAWRIAPLEVFAFFVPALARLLAQDLPEIEVPKAARMTGIEVGAEPVALLALGERRAQGPRRAAANHLDRDFFLGIESAHRPARPHRRAPPRSRRPR